MSELDSKVATKLEEWLYWHWDEGFTPEDIFKHYDWKEENTKRIVYNRLYYLTKTQKPPTLKKTGKLYRIIDREAEIIPWKTTNPEGFFNIILPFDLHKFVRLHKRSLMVVGGVSNEGKTTFAHNIISLNCKQHKVILWDSENSAEELAGRFCHYPNWESWPEDLAKDKSKNFSDVIEPDAINIIDYLEVEDNFWLVARSAREIRDALKDGVAIIVLQKSKKSELPLGGEFSIRLARVVITIDKGILAIIKAKDRAQKNINPVGKRWQFGIDRTGTQFIDIREYWGNTQE